MLPIFAFFCFGQILVFDEKLFDVNQSSFRSARLNQDRFQSPKIETRLIKNSFKTFIEWCKNINRFQHKKRLGDVVLNL